MDDSIVFLKTAAGEEAIRDRTLLAQRNLRNVLIVVDGVASVGMLKKKVGDAAMVEGALLELELLGFIALPDEAAKQEPPKSAHDERSGTVPPAVAYETDLTEGHSLSSQADSSPDTIPPDSSGSLSGKVIRVDDGTEHGDSHHPSESEEEALYEQAYGVEDPAFAPSIDAKRGEGRTPVSRKTRQRIAAVLAVGMLTALVLAVFRVVLYPYDEYRPDAEAALARAFDSTARIGAMRVSFMPSPVVIFEKVSLGDTPHVTFDSIRLVADPLSLLGGDRKFREVRLEGVRISDKGLAELSRWLRQVVLADWGVRSVEIEGLSMVVGGIVIGHLAGSAEVLRDRGLGNLVLRSKESSLTLGVTPTGNGVLLLVSARRWRLPFHPALLVSSFDARVNLSAGDLRIEQFDGTAFNGLYQGKGSVSWGNNPRAEIVMNIQNMDARELLEAWGAPAALGGAMTGRLTIAASAPTPDRLSEHIRLDGQFRTTRGSLAGIDLAEALRTDNLRSGEPVRGGRTDFEELSATIALDERTVRVSSARLDSGRLKATGHAEVVRQTGAITGSAVVGLHGSAGQRFSTVILAGTMDSPELRTR